jgi:hypothetical protein
MKLSPLPSWGSLPWSGRHRRGSPASGISVGTPQDGRRSQNPLAPLGASPRGLGTGGTGLAMTGFVSFHMEWTAGHG